LFTVEKGRSHNATVIYGDTDSVMVKFGPTDLETVMALGQLDLLTVSLIADHYLQAKKLLT